MKSLSIAFLVLVFLASSSWKIVQAIGDQSMNDIESQIWALEEAYIAAYKNAEHAKILALLHDQFLGWPDPEDKPTEINRVAEFLQEKYAKPRTWSFEINRAGIRVIGDVVITHYVINASGNDADGIVQKQATRITHTWIKEDSQWKILSGMSNVQ